MLMVFDEGAQKQKYHDTVSVKIMYPTVHLSISNVMYAVYTHTLKGVYVYINVFMFCQP
jgi:hypothetical protein